MAEGTAQGGGWIGAALPRREDPRLLRGEGRFVDDLMPVGCAFLAILRSPYGAGVITSLDVTDAQGAGGVLAVLTGADVADLGAASVNPLLPGARAVPMQVLAQGRVACVGQAVAALVATSRAAAQDALDLILLEVEEEASPPDPVLHHVWQSATPPGVTGLSVRAQTQHALVAPFALEPRAALALPEGAGLRLHLSTQTPHRCREDLCRMLNLPETAVQVSARDVGGAFGGKASLMPEDVLVALAARRLGRAVKWTASRSDEFQAATQGRGAHVMAEMWLDAAGRAQGLRAEMAFPLGHWMPHSALAPVRNAGRILPGPYAIAGVQVTARADLTEGPAVNIYRGAGRPEAAMVMERLMDRAAAALGLDPFEMRRRNLATPGPMPTGEALCSGDFAALLTRLEGETDYPALRRRQATRRAAGEVCGIGLALYVEPCGQGWESAELTLTPEGRFIARTGASAQGQGRETAVAQLLAEGLGVPPDRITVLHSDTGKVASGIGALASRSTAIGATAMWKAALALTERARAALGQPNGPVDWAAVPGPLSVQVRHEAEAEAWASGAVLAEVAIDPDTGLVTTERITWVDDAGRVLNPVLVEGQLLGGLAQGLGAALMERMVYQDGQLLTGSLMDYAVPRASDMPPVRLISQPVPSTANPLGFKGVGEAGCIGVPAALLNAVMDALPPGTPDLSPPLTPEKVWRALNGTSP